MFTPSSPPLPQRTPTAGAHPHALLPFDMKQDEKKITVVGNSNETFRFCAEGEPHSQKMVRDCGPSHQEEDFEHHYQCEKRKGCWKGKQKCSFVPLQVVPGYDGVLGREREGREGGKPIWVMELF